MPDATYNLNGGFKPTLKRFADLDGPDFFPTPAWATYALIDNESFRGDIWESACGDGASRSCLRKPAARLSPTVAFGARPTVWLVSDDCFEHDLLPSECFN
jgi:hypothetical protein